MSFGKNHAFQTMINRGNMFEGVLYFNNLVDRGPR